MHRPYHALSLKGDPVALGRGLVVGGPAVAWQFPDFGITPNPTDRFAPYDPTYETSLYSGKVVYEDQPGNYINSEVGLGYSAPTVLLLAQLAAGRGPDARRRGGIVPPSTRALLGSRSSTGCTRPPSMGSSGARSTATSR